MTRESSRDAFYLEKTTANSKCLFHSLYLKAEYIHNDSSYSEDWTALIK